MVREIALAKTVNVKKFKITVIEQNGTPQTGKTAGQQITAVPNHKGELRFRVDKTITDGPNSSVRQTNGVSSKEVGNSSVRLRGGPNSSVRQTNGVSSKEVGNSSVSSKEVGNSSVRQTNGVSSKEVGNSSVRQTNGVSSKEVGNSNVRLRGGPNSSVRYKDVGMKTIAITEEVLRISAVVETTTGVTGMAGRIIGETDIRSIIAANREVCSNGVGMFTGKTRDEGSFCMSGDSVN